MIRKLVLSAMASAILLLEVVNAVDPADDFSGYMENLEQRKRDEERYREQLHAHEVRDNDVSFHSRKCKLCDAAQCFAMFGQNTGLETNDMGRLGHTSAPGTGQPFCTIL